MNYVYLGEKLSNTAVTPFSLLTSLFLLLLSLLCLLRSIVIVLPPTMKIFIYIRKNMNDKTYISRCLYFPS